MRHAFSPIRFVSNIVLAAVALACAGCPDKEPQSYNYSGLLSDKFPLRVIENYSVDISSGDALLYSALMDTSGDGIYDVEVGLNGDTITHIKEINPQNDSLLWPKDLMRSSRPDKVQTPKPLLDIAASLKEHPTQADLDAYARGRPSSDAAWRLAVKLRHCNDDALRIRIIQAAELSLNNNDPRATQSAYILTGLGKHGIEALGRVLSRTVSTPQTPPTSNDPTSTNTPPPAATQTSAEIVTAALAATPVRTGAAHDDICNFLIKNHYWTYAQNNIFRMLTKEARRSSADFTNDFRADVEEVIKKRPDLEKELRIRLISVEVMNDLQRRP